MGGASTACGAPRPFQSKMEVNVEKTPIITMRHISKSFGGVRALVDAEIACCAGEVHALIGENGAGKSTLIKVLCGVVQPDAGEIYLRGEPIRLASPIDAAGCKIASVFQELSLLPDLSVAENVFLGCEPRGRLGLIRFAEMERRTRAIMEELGFDIDVSVLVKDLPLAEQQLVEIAKALSKDPDIIILDEATSALGGKEVALLFELLRRLTRERNKAVVFISHKMDELARIADRATIYRDARYIRSFLWGELTDSEIIDQIAGRKVDTIFPPKRASLPEEIALQIDDLWYRNKLRGVNLRVRRGEILGLAGLSGHGQNDLLSAVFGACRRDRGSIRVRGRDAAVRSPAGGLRAGIALTPADRKTDGLLLTRGAGENIALMTLPRRSRMGIIDRAAEAGAVAGMIDLLQIKLNGPDQVAGTLSGGNQQKLVIGKAILTDADILLLSDPTRGIDVGTKYEIYQLIRKLAEAGKTILFYSTENMELLGLCDRVAVFKQGEIVALLEGERFTEREILRAALGAEQKEVPA